MSEAKAELFAGMAAAGAELKSAAGGSVTETVAGWLAPEYAAAAHQKLTELAGDDRLSALQGLMHDWVKVRRSELAAARVQLRREELEIQRANAAFRKEKDFEEWMKRPDIREKYFPEKTKGITRETWEKIEKELRLL